MLVVIVNHTLRHYLVFWYRETVIIRHTSWVLINALSSNNNVSGRVAKIVRLEQVLPCKTLNSSKYFTLLWNMSFTNSSYWLYSQPVESNRQYVKLFQEDILLIHLKFTIPRTLRFISLNNFRKLFLHVCSFQCNICNQLSLILLAYWYTKVINYDAAYHVINVNFLLFSVVNISWRTCIFFFLSKFSVHLKMTKWQHWVHRYDCKKFVGASEAISHLQNL